MENFVFIRSNSTDPEFNIALDEKLLYLVGLGVLPDIVRFYKNSTSVILGRFQCKEFEIDEDYCIIHQIKIVKRTTGGGTVFHDLGNLNISVIVKKETLKSNYILENIHFLSSAIANALKYFNIEASIGKHNEILVGDKKVSGSAAALKYNGFLYHATLLLNSNLEQMKRALTPKKEYHPGSKCIKSNRASVMNIYELRYINENDLINRIYNEISRVFK
ncbi:MAG: lipoate--protein ligase family protein [Caldisericaceae bacterium]